ncbi:hypothetical protein AI2602V1_3145 [Citrobacter freundii]|nr:hypothetical protein WYG_0520 [Citrobacter sp. A1]EKU36368.1 hypothetical protein B397_0339 [Citrobacter sp. L17]EOQ24373.1 hypothetical protein WC1_01294 [Citrobacter sp. KTE30]ETX70286.1 hypothetical protein P834_05998 [Citrobacter freundii UCI 31]KLV46097.1 hypothetical protein SK31_01862 [Citrobacter sp. MGH99]OUE66309.1 hypothetical protein AZ006_003874 [Citrobacter freundii]
MRIMPLLKTLSIGVIKGLRRFLVDRFALLILNVNR